jgi:hypothetical protein
MTYVSSAETPVPRCFASVPEGHSHRYLGVRATLEAHIVSRGQVFDSQRRKASSTLERYTCAVESKCCGNLLGMSSCWNSTSTPIILVEIASSSGTDMRSTRGISTSQTCSTGAKYDPTASTTSSAQVCRSEVRKVGPNATAGGHCSLS